MRASASALLPRVLLALAGGVLAAAMAEALLTAERIAADRLLP